MEQLEANGEFFFTICSVVGGVLLLIGFILNSIVEGSGFGEFLDGVEDIGDLGVSEFEGFEDQVDDIISGDLPSLFLETPIGEFDVPVPSFFSFKILRVVLLVFGLGGNIALYILEWSFWDSFYFGLGTGFLSGFIVYKGLAYVYSQTIYHSRDPQVVGRLGKVILEIPSQGVGQIMVEIVQQRQTYRATSAGNITIKMNTQVQIIGKYEGVCMVRPYIKKTTN